MRLLVDTEIRTAVQNPAGNNAALAYVLEGNPPQRNEVGDSQIQPATLDLTIGEIFVPGSQDTAAGGSLRGKPDHALAQGETAVIRTRESLNMGHNRAGIAFPPSRTSLRGLLMTNPGHIDPGYDGPLHCTVINMGHETYPLRRGDRIMRVLFFGLDQLPQLAPRQAMPPIENQITTQLLGRLSVDFVDVRRRAKTIANAAVAKAAFISATVPIIVALVTVLGATFFTPQQKIQNDVLSLQKDFATTTTKSEEQSDIYKLESELASLKGEVKDNDYDERLKSLEAQIKTLVSAVQSKAHR